MEISSEFSNQQEVEAAIMEAWEKANENEKKEFKLKKEQAKQRKNENIEDMKLEQTKKEKVIQDMIDRYMSPNKIFQENKMGMSRPSIYNRKKVWSKYLFSWETAWIREKFKINWISWGIYFRANKSKQHIKLMRDKG